MGPETVKRIVLVDDDPDFLFSAGVTLRAAGIGPVHTITDSRQLLSFLSGADAAVVLLDLAMPHISGAELLPMVRERFPRIPVIVLTGTTDVNTVVDCMKAGAIDYLVKPVETGRFVSSIQCALELLELPREVTGGSAQVASPLIEPRTSFHGIVTTSRKVQAIFRSVEDVAASRQPVVITGETGAGKELVARAIHALSGCKGKFVAVNVAGLDDTMFSDTLFGHRKGAYTGAYQDREGLLARASGGTLFLDEIGDLDRHSQVKLLRLLEERTYYPLGADAPVMTDARILCATHQCLPGLMLAGTFRHDLFYRLQAHQIHVPPLRERRDDLPLLIDQCLEEAARSLGKKKPTPPPELVTLLSAYHFPGNVRELKSMVFDAVARHSSGVLSLDSFRGAVESGRPARNGSTAPPARPAGEAPLQIPERFPTLREAVDYLVAEALRRSRNNQGVAALLLGVTRDALKKRLSREKRQAREDESPRVPT